MNKRIQKYLEIIHSHAYDQAGFDYPLKITTALFSRWGPGDRFRFKNKSLTSINLITMGNAEYEQDGRRGILEKGHVFLAHKGSSQVLSTGSEGFLHKRSVILDGWALAILVDQTGLRQTDTVRLKQSSGLVSLMRAALYSLEQKHEGFEQQLAAIAFRILMYLAQAIGPSYPEELRKAREYISRNFTAEVSLDAICAAAGVSLRQCNRLFNDHLRSAPMQFVKQQRMTLAREMLLNTSLSIKQISLRAGYEDPLYFSQLFRQETGKSPREFRDK
jgi:AraC family transcriptional regulator of arabinose operon